MHSSVHSLSRPQRALAALLISILAVFGLAIGATTASAAAGQARLLVGESLTPGQRLVSPDGGTVLVLQTDGNLVLYGDGGALWHTHTDGRGGARLVLQGDGNLVLYDTAGRALWHTGTNGSAAQRLELQSDGNLVLYTAANAALWNSQTRYGHTALRAPTELRAGSSITSPNGKYRLIMQGDGNLVLYDASNRALWHTGTDGSGANRLAVQGDGNLVLYTASNGVSWQSGTRGAGLTQLRLQDDGSLVGYRSDNSVAWRASTGSSGGGTSLDGNQLLGEFGTTGGAYGSYRVGSNGCTTVTAWFVGVHTSLRYGGGNGGDVATKLVAANPGRGLAITNRPVAGAIFSSRDRAWGAVAQCSGTPCGHTGIVLSVDGNRVTVLETMSSLSNARPYARMSTITWSSSQQVDFVNVSAYLR